MIVSDFRGPRDWRKPLLRLAGRHEVVAIEVRDPREQLEPVGTLWLVDPRADASSRWTRTSALRARFAAAAAAERRRWRASSRRRRRPRGASTDRDWLRELAVFMRRRRR